MKKRSFPITTIALFLFFGVVIAFIGRSVAAGPGTTPNDKDKAIAARSAAASAGVPDERVDLPTDGAYVGGNGMVEPAQPETKVAAQVAGKIATVLVKEGDRVEKDAPLVTMESAVEEAALDAAEADLATAKATFARVAHGNRAEDVEAAIAEATSAKAKADDATTILARTEKLEQEGAATPEELDKAKNAAASAKASYDALASKAKAVTAGSRYEDVAEAKAKVAAAQARRDEAKAALDRLTIRAPIAGEVLRVKYRDGEFYNPGGAEPLLILGDTTKLRVRIDVDERDVAKVHLGADGFVVADAWKGRKFTGKVVELGKRMGRKNVRTDDPVERIDTKILEVVLELDDASTLVPGQRVMSFVQGT